MIVICVYRSLSGDFNNFLRLLDIALLSVNKLSVDVMNNKEVSIVKSAEAFNNYFLGMVEDLHIQIDSGTSPVSLLKIAYRNDFSQMNIIPVREGEIHSIICSLKAKD